MANDFARRVVGYKVITGRMENTTLEGVVFETRGEAESALADLVSLRGTRGSYPRVESCNLAATTTYTDWSKQSW